MAITKILDKSITNDSIIGSKLPDGTISVDKLLFSNNDNFVVPVGNTSQRPANSEAGTLRFNSQLLKFELYDGNDWKDLN